MEITCRFKIDSLFIYNIKRIIKTAEFIMKKGLNSHLNIMIPKKNVKQ